MTAENGVAVPANGDQAATGATESKGKGKGVAPAEEVPKDAMQEDDDEEEEEVSTHVRAPASPPSWAAAFPSFTSWQ